MMSLLNKQAISWSWAENWLSSNLSNHVVENSQEPQYLKIIAMELIENSVQDTYSKPDYPEKQNALIDLTDMYKMIRDASDQDWEEQINRLFPSMSQETVEAPTFQQIMENIEPKSELTMEDVTQEETPVEAPAISNQKPRRPIESILVLHPTQKKQKIPAKPGQELYNADRRAKGIIKEIYEDKVLVEVDGGQQKWSPDENIYLSKQELAY